MELLDPTPNGYSQVARIPSTSALVSVSGQIADGDGWEERSLAVFQTSAPRSRPAAQVGATCSS